MARRQKYKVELPEQERERLRRFVKTGKAKAREILRARMLLAADSGENGKRQSDHPADQSHHDATATDHILTIGRTGASLPTGSREPAQYLPPGRTSRTSIRCRITGKVQLSPPLRAIIFLPQTKSLHLVEQRSRLDACPPGGLADLAAGRLQQPGEIGPLELGQQLLAGFA